MHVRIVRPVVEPFVRIAVVIKNPRPVITGLKPPSAGDLTRI